MVKRKGMSQLVVAIGLVAIAIFLIAYAAPKYLYLAKQSVPHTPPNIDYAKLVFISDRDTSADIAQSVFKLEVGVNNPESEQTLKICMYALNLTAALSNSTTEYKVEIPISGDTNDWCVYLHVAEGFHTYSVLLKVPNDYLSRIGCASPVSCPYNAAWIVEFYDEHGERIGAVKPLYIVP